VATRALGGPARRSTKPFPRHHHSSCIVGTSRAASVLVLVKREVRVFGAELHRTHDAPAFVEDVFDSRTVLPTLVGDSADLHNEALEAGASAEWLDPNSPDAREFELRSEMRLKQLQEGVEEEDDEGEAEDEEEGEEEGDDDISDESDERGAGKRFAVGARVRCRVSHSAWKAGVVIAHDYREADFPPNVRAAYQVKLTDGTLIYAPVDSDECIRAA
jgi:hypothetical protein